MRPRRPSAATIIALTALAVALGGVALAAPGDGGVISACSNDHRGTLRVVDAGVACAADETALDWNRQGPAGPPGERGPAGADGAAGAQPADSDPAGAAARSPAFDAPVKKPKIKLNAKKPKIKIKPKSELPGALFQRSAAEARYLPAGVVKTVARLELPAGRYLVIADAQGLAKGDGNPPYVTPDVRCELHTSGQNGAKVAGKWLRGRDVRAFTIQAFHTGGGLSAVELRCQNAAGLTSVYVSDVALSALHVNYVIAKTSS